MAPVVKNPLASAADASSIPGSRRAPGEGDGIPLRYPGLGNSTDRGAWWATVCGVAKSQTQVKQLSTQHSTFSGTIFPDNLPFILDIYVSIYTQSNFRRMVLSG